MQKLFFPFSFSFFSFFFLKNGHIVTFTRPLKLAKRRLQGPENLMLSYICVMTYCAVFSSDRKWFYARRARQEGGRSHALFSFLLSFFFSNKPVTAGNGAQYVENFEECDARK